MSQRIEEIAVNEFVIQNSIERYKSLGHFISSFQDPESQPYLLECLPPSEYGMFNGILSLSLSSRFYIDYYQDLRSFVFFFCRQITIINLCTRKCGK